MTENPKKRFLHDIKNHQMTIEHDSGVFRSIYFGRPETMAYSFRLVTWPGHLAISGDMGDYIFARLPDMFDFFRGDGLRINYSYWKQKLKAISRFGSADGDFEEYDGVATAKRVREGFYNNKRSSEIREVLEEIKLAGSVNDYFAIADQNNISDPYEFLSQKPTMYIQWIMYAIVWGIQKYDAAKKVKIAA